MSEGKFYRVFNGRLISELMLVEQLRAQQGALTVPQLIALLGLPPTFDQRVVYALCKRYAIPVKPYLAPSLISYQDDKRAGETTERVRRANALRLAEIARARAEAPTAPLYRAWPP